MKTNVALNTQEIADLAISNGTSSAAKKFGVSVNKVYGVLYNCGLYEMIPNSWMKRKNRKTDRRISSRIIREKCKDILETFLQNKNKQLTAEIFNISNYAVDDAIIKAGRPDLAAGSRVKGYRGKCAGQPATKTFSEKTEVLSLNRDSAFEIIKSAFNRSEKASELEKEIASKTEIIDKLQKRVQELEKEVKMLRTEKQETISYRLAVLNGEVRPPVR